MIGLHWRGLDLMAMRCQDVDVSLAATLQARVRSKVGQLTKVWQHAGRCYCLSLAPHKSQLTVQVIQHLNARETDTSLGSAAGEYESEIQQMLQQTVQQVNSFAEQIELRKEEARMKVMVQVSHRLPCFGQAHSFLWSQLLAKYMHVQEHRAAMSEADRQLEQQEKAAREAQTRLEAKSQAELQQANQQVS